MDFLFLAGYEYAVLFLWVFADQLGVPVPVVPFLIVVGGLSESGRVDMGPAILAGAAATMLSDGIWYEIGRRRGRAVLGFACRFSMEPGSCIGRTEKVFARFGRGSLIVGKFMPGFSAVAAPMAGLFRVPRHHFVLFSAAGAALWCGTFIGLGRAFSDQVEVLTRTVLSTGPWVFAAVAVPLAVYLFVKRWRCVCEESNGG